jgi:hypothetical protein
MAGYCEADELLELLMPSYDFKDSLTPEMIKKMTKLPPRVREKVMDAGFVVDGETMADIVTGSNPQRLATMKQKRGWGKIEEKMSDPYLRSYAETLVGGRRKQQAMNSEELYSATYGVLERWEKIAENGQTLADAIAKGDDDTAYWVLAKMNEAQALSFQLAGAKAEAGRTLGYVRRLKQMEQKANLTTLFNGLEC